MSCTRIVTWNRKDVPPELRALPPGPLRHRGIEEDASPLSAEEEAGIDAALESGRQCRVVDGKRVRQIIDATVGRRSSLCR
jgi:hypothetical protein